MLHFFPEVYTPCTENTLEKSCFPAVSKVIFFLISNFETFGVFVGLILFCFGFLCWDSFTSHQEL